MTSSTLAGETALAGHGRRASRCARVRTVPAGRSDTARRARALDDHGFPFVFLQPLDPVAHGHFQFARGIDHRPPGYGIEREIMIRADPRIVIGKMLLDHASAQSHRTQHGGMAGRMIRKTDRHSGPTLGKCRDHVQIHVAEIFKAARVIPYCIASHTIRRDVSAPYRRQLVCRPCRPAPVASNTGLPCRAINSISERKVMSPDPTFVGGNDIGKHFHRFGIIWRGHEFDIGLLAGIDQFLRPFAPCMVLIVNLIDRLFPSGLCAKPGLRHSRTQRH